MIRRTSAFNISKIIIILALILLAGVITMMVGFSRNNSFTIYIGIFITAAISFLILFHSVISNSSGKYF